MTSAYNRRVHYKTPPHTRALLDGQVVLGMITEERAAEIERLFQAEDSEKYAVRDFLEKVREIGADAIRKSGGKP